MRTFATRWLLLGCVLPASTSACAGRDAAAPNPPPAAAPDARLADRDTTPIDTPTPDAPAQPTNGLLALARFPMFETGPELRTLQRVASDSTGAWFAALEYGFLTLSGEHFLAGRIETGSGTGWLQTTYVLLPADDTMGMHPVWKAKASERWVPGPFEELPPNFLFRGCVFVLGDSLLGYAAHATAAAPPEVFTDSLTPAPGLYRVEGGEMRRVRPIPREYVRRCAREGDPDPD